MTENKAVLFSGLLGVIITLVFILLKVLAVIDWEWILVFIPLIAGAAVVIIYFVMIMIASYVLSKHSHY